MTHTGGCECVCVGSVSRLCMCVFSLFVSTHTVLRSGWHWIWTRLCNVSPEDADNERNRWVCAEATQSDWSPSGFRIQRRVCRPLSVWVNSFLRLLWLNEHHLYVCLGVYSAKCWNPNSAAGSVCSLWLGCQGEAGFSRGWWREKI